MKHVFESFVTAALYISHKIVLTKSLMFSLQHYWRSFLHTFVTKVFMYLSNIFECISLSFLASKNFLIIYSLGLLQHKPICSIGMVFLTFSLMASFLCDSGKSPLYMREENVSHYGAIGGLIDYSTCFPQNRHINSDMT